MGLVFIAIGLTELLELEPCPLCVFQRLLYLLAGGGLLLGAAWPRGRAGMGAFSLLASAGGFATAAYQSWMQAFPLRFMECGSGAPANPIEHLVDRLGQVWPWMFYASGECTSREWEWLGLSMANWSALAFLAFTIAIGWMLYCVNCESRAPLGCSE